MFSSLLLLLLPSCSLAAVSSTLVPWPSDMQVRPNEGEMVLATGMLEVLEADPLTSNGESTVIYVESDVPVVAERLTAGSSAFLEPPIPWGSAMVIVKSSGCPEGTTIDVDMENSNLENGKDYSLKISTTTTTTTTSDAVLDSSALFRQLGCASQIAPPCEPPSPTAPLEAVAPTAAPATTTEGDNQEGTTSQATNASVLLSLLFIGFSALFSGSAPRAKGSALLLSVTLGIGAAICLLSGSSSSAPPVVQAAAIHRELQECTVNVEIAYWGCTTLLNATAPALVLRNLHQETTEDRENCNCTSLATFPDLDEPRDKPEFEYLDYDANNTVATDGNTYQVPLAGSSNCLLAIGRPFKDQEGSTLQAIPNMVSQKEAAWSKADQALWKHYNSQQHQSIIALDGMMEDWTQRALGEHASVASFAAFTIALQSNGAPPDLILASLQAAQDEVRHAQISFRVATILDHGHGNSPAVEPKSLPPSSLTFGANLTALAIGVLEEGCIDETMSALEMAASVDDHQDDLLENMWLWNITEKIALEEGQHAVLAWRTLHWICKVDATICDHVLKEDRVMAVALRKYDSSSLAFQVWKMLACHASGWKDCSAISESVRAGSLMAQLANEIMIGVTQGENKMIA